MSADFQTGPWPSSFWVARATLVVVAIMALVWLTWRLSPVLLLLFGAVVFAAILRGATGLVQKWTPLGEKWSLVVAGLIIALVFVGFFALLGTQISAQFAALREELPDTISSLGDRLGVDVWQQIRSFGRGGWVRDLLGYVPDLLGALASIILVSVGGVFLAINPAMYREGVLKLVPGQKREEVRSTMSNAGRALRLWLLGKMISMVVIGAVTTAGLLILGIPSALALGLIAGLLEFIPFIGPILSFIPAGLVALSTGDSSLWWVLGLYILIQQIENNLLVPLIQQKTVELPPVLGLFAVVAFGLVFGPVGIILGVPLTIVLMVAVKQLYVRNTLGEEVSVPGENKK